MGFWMFGILSVVLAVLKLTVAGYWSWWRVMLPFMAFLGHSAVYLLAGFLCFCWLKHEEDEEEEEEPTTVQKHSREGYNIAALLFFFLFFGQPVATRRRTRLEGVLAVLGEIRGGGPVWDVESGGTVCVLVADCQRPQSSRARLKPETMTVTFEEFSSTHDFFDHKRSGEKPGLVRSKGHAQGRGIRRRAGGRTRENSGAHWLAQ